MPQPAPLRERKKVRTRAAIAQAALELFGARGFSDVTLAEVAAAADVGQRTLFRYFSDKEELLFDDDEALQADLRTALAGRPEREPPVTAVREALLALVSRWQDQREHGQLRRAVIDGSAALRARELAKHRAYEGVLLDGLTARGLDPAQGRLLARVAVVSAEEALARWYTDEDPGRPGLPDRVRGTFVQLAGLLGDLDPPAPSEQARR